MPKSKSKRAKPDDSGGSSSVGTQSTLDSFINQESSPSKLDTMDTITIAMKDLFEKLFKQFSEQLREDIDCKLEEVKGAIFDMKQENEKLRKIVEKNNEEISALREQNKALKHAEKLNRSTCNNNEQYSRRNSIRIFGLEKKEKESLEECETNVIKLISNKLNIGIEGQEIEACHRVGKNNATIVKFTNRKLQEQIIRNRRKLKGTKYVINEDMTKINLQGLMRAKAHPEVEVAYFSKGKVYVVLKNGRRMVVNTTVPLDEQLQTTRAQYPYTPVSTSTPMSRTTRPNITGARSDA